MNDKPAIRKGKTELPEKSHFRKLQSKLPKTPFYVHYMRTDDYFRLADKPSRRGGYAVVSS